MCYDCKMDILPGLNGQFKGEVVNDAETLTRYSRDASLFEIRPVAVALPKDTADIKTLVKYAAAHSPNGVSLTVRSGGTCMSGGPLSQSVVVDVNAHLNRLLHIDSD